MCADTPAERQCSHQARPVAHDDLAAVSNSALPEQAVLVSDAHTEWVPPPRFLSTAFSGLISVALHGCLFVFVVLAIENRPGAVEFPSDAISIELVASDVLESVEDATSQSSAMAASVSAHAGVAEDSPAQQQAAQEPPDIATPNEPQERPVEDTVENAQAESDRTPEPVIESQAIVSDEPALEISKPSEVDTLPPIRQAETPPRKEVAEEQPRPRDKPRQRRSQPETQGGRQSKSATGSSASSGRVSASTGDMQTYARAVQARVAARRPGGEGRRGTVIISFAVTRSGGLSYASISSSSGDAALDQSVLSAVRSAAPFPAPPAGAPSGGLRFRMPFYFR